MQNIVDTWKKLRTLLETHAPEVLQGLQPGASEHEIAALETHLQVRLPDDYRVFLSLCNGQRDDAHAGFYDGELLSLQNVQFQWQIWKTLVDDGTFNGINSQPDAGVSNDWYNLKWIPFTHDGGGNHLCLDLNPAPGGTFGQVIAMWHDSAERECVYDSFSAWLEHVALGLGSGEIVYDEEEYAALVDAEDVE